METRFNFEDFIARLDQAKDNYEEQVRLQAELMHYFMAAPADEQEQLRDKVQAFLGSKFSSLDAKLTEAEQRKKDKAA